MKKYKKSRDIGLFKYIRFFSVPVIVIVLVAVIIIADRSKHKETDSPSLSTVGVETSVLAESVTTEMETMAETLDEENREKFIPKELEINAVPEINELADAYFKARISCDAEAMDKLYGKTDTEGLEEERTKLQLSARYIKSIDNITCYTKQALDVNSWVVYISADVHFRSVETPAPIVMSSYVVRQATGIFEFVHPSLYTKEILDFMDQEAVTEDARNLARLKNSQLAEALAADEALNEVYGTLNAGSPVWTERVGLPQETEVPVEILGDETESTCAPDYVIGDGDIVTDIDIPEEETTAAQSTTTAAQTSSEES